MTASNNVLQSKEAKPIFENTKTIIDNAIEGINSGLIELAESENNQDDDVNEEPVGDEVDDPLAEFRANPGSLFPDENDDGA